MTAVKFKWWHVNWVLTVAQLFPGAVSRRYAVNLLKSCNKVVTCVCVCVAHISSGCCRLVGFYSRFFGRSLVAVVTVFMHLLQVDLKVALLLYQALSKHECIKCYLRMNCERTEDPRRKCLFNWSKEGQFAREIC